MKFFRALLTSVTIPLMGGDANSAPSTIYNFVTIAGLAPGSADGTNSAARFNYPSAVAVDSGSNVFVADAFNHTIRKLTPIGTNWVSSTIAGLPGTEGSADGINSAARFNFPSGIAVDSAGNVFVADAGNETIRKLTPVGANWVSSTIAGLAGSYGSADGTNSAAQFAYPSGVAVDSGGNVYVADEPNNTIRKLTPVGTNWVSSTIAGLPSSSGIADGTDSAARFSSPIGITVDGAGNVYVTGDNAIRKLMPVGTNWVSSTIAGLAGSPGDADGTNGAARFESPWSIAVDRDGNVYVADSTSSVIRKLALVGTNWVSSTVAGMLTFPWITGSADGTNSTVRFNNPEGIALDNAGNVYVADTGNNTIRKLTPVSTNWVSSTIAGVAGSPGSADGTNSAARFQNPWGVAVERSGNVLVADWNNNAIRKLTLVGSNWVSRTIAGLAGSSGSADGTNTAAQFRSPAGLAVDSGGNVYVAEYNNSTIRKLTPVGTNWVSSTIAGLARNPGSDDGTDSGARFNFPTGVAADTAGNVYVADQDNHTIRKLTLAGSNWVSSTIVGLAGKLGSADGTNSAARFALPAGVAVDTAGNVYVADAGNSTIRKLTPVGTDWASSTIAGLAGSQGSDDGSNSNARFSSPTGVAVDTAGNVYVTDGDNRTIRKLTPVGTNWVSSTIAGLAGSLGSADGNISAARFWDPFGIAVDNGGNIYVTDYFNNTIREGLPLAVSPSPPVLTVTRIPPPCIYWECGSASLNITWSALPGLTYQLQYNSDLTSTNWHDLGHGTTSAHDTLSQDPQRFYRIVLLP